MPHILAVFGATGQQGSSVINNVLADPELSQRYSLRAITRDVESAKASQLRDRGVEVVAGDVSDRASIDSALAGAHTVFAVTTPDFGPDPVGAELAKAKTIADAAVASGASYLIWSTLPAVDAISNGRYPLVSAFDAKAKAEEYIRGLPIRSAFFSGGFFMENFHTQPYLAPQLGSDGTTYELRRPCSPGTKIPFFAAVADAGKFVGAILADPDGLEGRTLHAAEGMYSMDELAAVWARATGRDVVFRQVSRDEFARSMPFAGELFADLAEFTQEYGYFGPGSDELVERARGHVRGRLTTFDEFFAENPVSL